MKTRTIGRGPISRAAQAVSKVGMTKLGNRAIAEVAAPSDQVGNGSNRTMVYTYFTKVPVPGEPTAIIYNGDRIWARVILHLETAGPVAVGTMSQLSPVLSGKGQLLETGEPMPFVIAKGSKLYIAATAVNRVKVTVEPFPWLEQLLAVLAAGVGKVFGVSAAVSRTADGRPVVDR